MRFGSDAVRVPMHHSLYEADEDGCGEYRGLLVGHLLVTASEGWTRIVTTGELLCGSSWSATHTRSGLTWHFLRCQLALQFADAAMLCHHELLELGTEQAVMAALNALQAELLDRTEQRWTVESRRAAKSR